MEQNRSNTTRKKLPALLCLLCAFPAGCAINTPHASRENSQTILAQYADLIDGKLSLIADFEDPRHQSLCDVLSISGQAKCSIQPTPGSRRAGSQQPGSLALQCTLADTRDAIILDNTRTNEIHLQKDWRPYDLLFIRIFSPASPITLEITIVSGKAESRRQAGTTVPLHRGWNDVRLDLSEAVDRVNMADIRRIIIQTGNTAPKTTPTNHLNLNHEPITFAIDDIILAQNRRNVYGQPDNNEGTMYLQNQGRRWRVGAGRQFELIFSQGQIVAWYELANDPDRTNNLLQACAMGPMPTVLPESHDEPNEHAADFADLGTILHTRQRVVEMNDIRVIIECEWTYTKDPDQTPDHQPTNRWKYTIYRTGQIYVELACRTKIENWSVDSVGLALCIDQIENHRKIEHSTARLESPEALRHISFAAAAHPTSTPSILFVAHDGRTAPQADVIADPREKRLILLLSGGKIEKPIQKWSCMVSLKPSNQTEISQAQQRALAYVKPITPTISGGILITNTLGDRNNDGFNEAQGSYQVEAHAKNVTIALDGSDQSAFSPAFTVTGLNPATTQIKTNGQPFPPSQFAATPNGQILLQIPGPISSPLEITLTQKPRLAKKTPMRGSLLSEKALR